MIQVVEFLAIFTYNWLGKHLINKRHGSPTLEQTIWLWNHTSHPKVYFNEFVANVLRDNIGIVIFDLWGCWRPKTPLGVQKWHEEVDFLKKVFNQSFSTTSQTPWRDKKETASSEVTLAVAATGSNLEFPIPHEIVFLGEWEKWGITISIPRGIRKQGISLFHSPGNEE